MNMNMMMRMTMMMTNPPPPLKPVMHQRRHAHLQQHQRQIVVSNSLKSLKSQQRRKTEKTVLVDLDNIAYNGNVYHKQCLESRLRAMFVALPPSQYKYTMYCNVHTSKFLHEHGFKSIMHLVDVAPTTDKDAADHELISQYLMLIEDSANNPDTKPSTKEHVTIVTADKNLARIAYYFHRPPAELRFGTFKTLLSSSSCSTSQLNLHKMTRFSLSFNDRNDHDSFVNSLMRFYKYQHAKIKKLY